MLKYTTMYRFRKGNLVLYSHKIETEHPPQTLPVGMRLILKEVDASGTLTTVFGTVDKIDVEHLVNEQSGNTIILTTVRMENSEFN